MKIGHKYDCVFGAIFITWTFTFICFTHALHFPLRHRTEAGDKFIVKDQARLSAECIPLYFSHSNFSSFTRQLNFYRFRKMFPSVKLGPGNDIVPLSEKHLIFYHEKFHRDHPGEWGGFTES